MKYNVKGKQYMHSIDRPDRKENWYSFRYRQKNWLVQIVETDEGIMAGPNAIEGFTRIVT